MIPQNIEWAWPWAAFALPLPILVYFLLPAVRQVRDRALRVPTLEPFKHVQAGATKSGKALLSGLILALMWMALVTAAARPQSFGEAVGMPISGRDLMLCIDISGSMNEQDLYSGQQRVTRMAVVKYVASDFVARRSGDRIGLIMFGSNAYVQSPLTYDHETIQHFLDEAVVGLAGRSTAIGDAIGLGVKRLRDRPAESRVLILLTDGENSEGAVDPIDAAQIAAENDIRIYTIGVGSDSAGSIFGGAFGSRRSAIDEVTLKTIAAQTGGQYFRARDQRELESIYRDIDRLEPTDKDDLDFRPLRELFVWPLSAALLLSVLWAFTRRTQLGLGRA